MQKIIATSALTVLLAACGQDNSATPIADAPEVNEAAVEKHSGLLLENMNTEIRPGDDFRILYERLYRVDADDVEHYVRPGRILAARFRGAAGEFMAVYFEEDDGKGGYFRPDGRSVEREFLVSPLEYGRISSNWTQARRHPILNVTRPHHGIDYAAPTGTPVYAVSMGEVIYKSRAGGYGNLVKIRHAGGYVTYYGHLSRFVDGLHVGQPVSQKQVIGYVGSTGLSTGPHVCFRVAKDGKYVNPIQLPTPRISRRN